MAAPNEGSCFVRKKPIEVNDNRALLNYFRLSFDYMCLLRTVVEKRGKKVVAKRGAPCPETQSTGP